MHTKILVAYFIIFAKKNLKYKQQGLVIISSESYISAFLYNRKINMNFEEKIKTTYKRSDWKLRLVVEKFEVGIENINYDAVEKPQRQSKKFDAIDSTIDIRL